MFRWSPRNAASEQFNALNPQFASVFHVVFDNFGSGGVKESFLHAANRELIINDFIKGPRARAEVGIDKAKYNLADTFCGLLAQRANAYGDDEDCVRENNDVFLPLLGIAAALPLLGQLIFGFAPGLASGDPVEAHKLTIEIIRSLQAKCKNMKPELFFDGVHQLCSELLDACDEQLVSPWFNEREANSHEGQVTAD